MRHFPEIGDSEVSWQVEVWAAKSARLKHKDVRKRRRAIRVLFDTDIPRALEGFVPCSTTKTHGFAPKRWRLTENGHLLKVSKPCEFWPNTPGWMREDVAADLLNEFFRDTTDIALLLIEDNDLTCQLESPLRHC